MAPARLLRRFAATPHSPDPPTTAPRPQAKKPLTSKDIENKLADAEERRQMEIEQIKYKGREMGKAAPHARQQAAGREESKWAEEEKCSHK